MTRLGLSMFLMLAGAGLAGATTIVVPPGPGTPVQDAIDAAAPGDTIRLTLGIYPETLVITKSLKLRGVRSRSPQPNDTTVLTGSCGGAFPRITVAADSVQVRGIQVVGDSGGGVQVFGHQRVKLLDVFVSSYCPVSGSAFDVEQSTRVTMKKVWASGRNQSPVPHPGIRIADVPQEGRVRVQTSVSAGYVIGVLLENDGILSVRVSSSAINFNDRGVVLQNTSRAVIDHNFQVIDNTTSGIELDAASSGNSIVRNTISGSVNDVVDAGTGNCWRNNVYTTGSVPPCP